MQRVEELTVAVWTVWCYVVLMWYECMFLYDDDWWWLMDLWLMVMF